ncbi:MAG: DNA-protecting protein DprA [candidate division Zixibacteria bacterium]|nr:DNA-protecting protein DprA [candidate division Zixibacteria bacterium]
MEELSSYSNTVKTLALAKYANIGPRQFAALMHQFGDLDTVLTADTDSLSAIESLDPEAIELIQTTRTELDWVARYHDELTQRDIKVATRFDPDYPRPLEELNDPPPLLYVRGQLPDNSLKSVTVIGASQASQEGIELTVSLTRLLAEANIQVVSSLRGGVDGAVHLGVKAAKGRSFAVLDSGVDHLDLTEQTPLAVDIAQEGGLIAEYAPDVEQDPDHLKEVNRLLVGLSQAVVVTEFYNDSHSTKDTLSFCHDIGKLVFLMVDPKHGALSDETALATANEYGAVPIVGLDQVDNIIKALV